jgi:predicted GIY-YIG superfamily endonuclease
MPVELTAVIELPDESSARREEARIKRLSRPEKLALARVHTPARRSRSKPGA